MLITEEKVTKTVFLAIPLKDSRLNTIPVIVWQKLWQTIKNLFICLFITSIKLSIIPD